MGNFLLPKLEKDGTKLAIVPDHDFAPVNKAVNVKRLLEELGYERHYKVGNRGAIYTISNDKFLISKDRRREELIQKLTSYTVEGKRILEVYPKAEIYWRELARKDPDLLVWPRRGARLYL